MTFRKYLLAGIVLSGLFLLLPFAGAQQPATHYFILQHDGPIPVEWQGRLESAGYQVVGYAGDDSYIVRAEQQPSGVGRTGQVRPYSARQKVTEDTRRYLRISDDEGKGVFLTVSFFRTEKLEAVAEKVKMLAPFSKFISQYGDGFIVHIPNGLANALDKILDLDGISHVGVTPMMKPQNDNGVWIIQGGANATDTHLYEKGLTGAGQTIAIADSGLDDDSSQFRYSSGASAQTLHKATPLMAGSLAVEVTNPSNRVITYYLLGIGNTISSPNNPNGGVTLNPDQITDGAYHNAVAYDDNAIGPYHGTLTTSTAAGRHYAANGSGAVLGIPTRTSGDGVAPDAKIVFQDIGHYSGQLPGANFIDQFVMQTQAYNSGARVQNNSYAGAIHSAADAIDVGIDKATWLYRDFLPVYAVGNYGNGGNSQTSAWGFKNAIAAGATDSPSGGGSAENVAYYSSHGHPNTGRLFPTIVAPGYVFAATENSGLGTPLGPSTSRTANDSAINPTSPNNTHTLSAAIGTSFASPMVAGGAILVRQYFVSGYYPNGSSGTGQMFTPSNALLKAVIVNSARQATGAYTADNGAGTAPIPSYGQGWGRVALDDALYFAGDSRKLRVLADIFNGATASDATRPAPNAAITTGVTHTYTVGNQSNTQPLRITLNWSDPPSTVGDATPLINNLNLEVTSPDGTIYKGNVFSGGFSQTGGTADSDNTLENVYINNPLPGIWTIKVIGQSVPGNGMTGIVAQPGNQTIDSNRQGYALIATGAVVAPAATTSTSLESAGFQSQAAPGELMTVFSGGFPGGVTIAQNGTGNPLPTVIGNVSVRVNGVNAPLLYVGVSGGAGQINYQLPWGATNSTAYIEVLYNNTPVACETRTVNQSGAPGVFTVSGTGTGQANVLNFPSYTANSAGNPAPRGSTIIVYATGTGLTNNQSTGLPGNPGDGYAAPGSPLYVTPSTPTVTIGGVSATVTFSGLASGFVSLWQINAVVPASAPTGSGVPIVVSLGGKSSRISGVTIAVN